MKHSLLLSTLLLSTSFITEAQEIQHGLVGFAATPAYGLEGTIGGGLGEVVKVTTEADLRKYCQASGPYTILFEGTIKLTNEKDIQVTSDKTIIGLNGNAILDGIGFNASGVSNVIIRGFTIRNAHADAIAFRTSHHVWVDHCDLSASDDGLLDYTIGSDLLTASWNRFSNHDKVSVVNSGTQHYEDVDKENVSYHHNSFISTTQRNPRIGYGRGHVWNNYYESVSSYCVGYFTGARVIIERNYFYKSKTPLQQMYSSDPTSAHYAEALSIDNVFSSCSGNTQGTGSAFDVNHFYEYTTTLDAVNDVPTIVRAGAGPVKGLEYDLIPLPNHGRIDYPESNPTLRWSKAPDAVSYDVYLSTSATLIADHLVGNTTTNAITPHTLQPATTYYWRVDTRLADGTLTGQVWQFTTAATTASKPYPADGEQNAQLQAQLNANTTQPMTLTWSPAFGAEGYSVMLSDGEGRYEAAELAAGVTSWQPATLPRGKQYSWKVTPIINGNPSAQATTWSFTSPIIKIKEGVTEAEAMTRGLRAYVENPTGWFTASGNRVIGGESGPGTLNGEWDGDHVKAKIVVRVFDESDGKGTYKLFVDDVQQGKFTASTNKDQLVDHTICEAAELKAGSQIRLEFAPESGEGCRTDYIRITVVEKITGIEQIENDLNTSGRSYNLMGIPVGEDYEGVIIRDGRKEIRRR